MARYFEDFRQGDVIETEGVTITEAHVVDFALRYDPQPFHIDAVAAAAGPFGGLIASGFLTLALTFRLFRDTGTLTGSSMGGSGADELRWLKPVRPGDTLRVRATVLDAAPSRRGDRGTVRIAYATLNQQGETVQTVTMNHIVARREPSAAAPTA